MSRKLLVAIGLAASLANSATCFAQAPAAPAIPGMPAPAAPAAPAAPGNIWSMLCPTAEQKAACKQCFCNSPIGQMVNGAAGPMAAMSGGMMGGCCAKNSLALDLKKAADDPNGLAARIKADEEDAKARRAAVRYLGTVDCSYWPEATEVLKSALRKDRNECVRFEAALSLRRGCCCNKETIEALTNCVLGENKKDPFPAERSERVRAVAADALIRCPQLHLEQPRMNEKLVRNDSKPPIADEFSQKVADLSTRDLTANARAILASLHDGGKQQPEEKPHVALAPPPPLPSPGPVMAPRHSNNSVSGIVANAFASSSSQPSSDGAAPRQPFFSNLTRTLTGKQEASPWARQRGMVSPSGATSTAPPLAAPANPSTPPTSPPPVAPDSPFTASLPVGAPSSQSPPAPAMFSSLPSTLSPVAEPAVFPR